jgi:hypothetical protein
LAVASAAARAPRSRPSRDRPTEQTLRKRERDVLLYLLEKGALAQEQVAAAIEIKDAWMYRTSELTIRTTNLERPRQPGMRGPLGRHEAWVNRRFVVWARAMNEHDLAVPPVVDICLDNAALGACDRTYGKRNGWAKQQLRDGLALYCDLHGLWWRPR